MICNQWIDEVEDIEGLLIFRKQNRPQPDPEYVRSRASTVAPDIEVTEMQIEFGVVMISSLFLLLFCRDTHMNIHHSVLLKITQTWAVVVINSHLINYHFHKVKMILDIYLRVTHL